MLSRFGINDIVLYLDLDKIYVSVLAVLRQKQKSYVCVTFSEKMFTFRPNVTRDFRPSFKIFKRGEGCCANKTNFYFGLT